MPKVLSGSYVMPEADSRFYWDSNVLLTYINGDQDRLPIIDALMSQVDKGDIEILTSVITIAEVAWGATERAQAALDP